MKKSLIAFAALATIAGAASAQSSVTLYGRVDLSVGKYAGTDAKTMTNGSGSRFGVRGVEDLGGGMSAFFNIEHRFNADTGAQTNGAIPASSTSNAAPGGRFWFGRSLVGLQGSFGKISLGREYTTAFLQSQLAADPWGWDTVVSQGSLNDKLTGGLIARVRNDSSVTYNFSAAGFSVGAQIAEATDTISNFQKRPVNFAVNYAAGPFSVGVAHERTGEVAADKANWTTLTGTFNLGMVKLGALYGDGNTAAGADHKSYMLTAVAPMGQGEFRASYGRLKDETNNITAAKGLALGYHYALSKRTTLYTDYVRNTALADNKTGYDFGIKHNF
ncbi:MAG TPA: porin [Aquabacterium sp.]|nr:porin [Aquabacterium sp.]